MMPHPPPKANLMSDGKKITGAQRLVSQIEQEAVRDGLPSQTVAVLLRAAHVIAALDRAVTSGRRLLSEGK